MPIHDWKTVEADLFHEFHQIWAMKIHDALNGGLLPTGYSALVENHAGRVVPDVLSLKRRTNPDRPPAGGGVMTATLPNAQLIMPSKLDDLTRKANRVAIHHRLGNIVCIIEIVSPGNKAAEEKYRDFVMKAAQYLDAGVHMLIIDLLPPGPRDPYGLHFAIWDAISRDAEEDITNKPFTLASYAAGSPALNMPIRAFVQRLDLYDVIPDWPAFLDNDSYIPIPLEKTYMLAWSSCPADMRFLVEHGRLPEEGE